MMTHIQQNLKLKHDTLVVISVQ